VSTYIEIGAPNFHFAVQDFSKYHPRERYAAEWHGCRSYRHHDSPVTNKPTPKTQTVYGQGIFISRVTQYLKILI